MDATSKQMLIFLLFLGRPSYVSMKLTVLQRSREQYSIAERLPKEDSSRMPNARREISSFADTYPPPRHWKRCTSDMDNALLPHMRLFLRNGWYFSSKLGFGQVVSNCDSTPCSTAWQKICSMRFITRRYTLFFMKIVSILTLSRATRACEKRTSSFEDEGSLFMILELNPTKREGCQCWGLLVVDCFLRFCFRIWTALMTTSNQTEPTYWNIFWVPQSW